MDSERLMNDKAARYLDGEMTYEEAAHFERELLEPALSRALCAELWLRGQLTSLGPLEPPEELMGELEAICGDGEGRKKVAAKQLAKGAWGAFLAGMAWSVRGPGLAFAGWSPKLGRASLEALSTMRHSLGPLGERSAHKPAEPVSKAAEPSWIWRLLRRRK